MKIKALTIAIAATLGVSSGAQAFINFDRNGTAAGGSVATDVFDWAPGNVLFQNIVTSPLGTTGFTLKGHGNLSTFLRNNASVGSALPGNEFTYTFEIPMLATQVGGGSRWDLNAVSPGVFEIFFDSTANINTNSGAGFHDGALILQGAFLPKIAVPGQSGFLSVISNPVTQPLDGFGSNGKPGITSDLVSGNIAFEIDATYADSDFFLTDVVTSDLLFGFDLNLSSQVLAPFSQTNPSTVVGGVAGETSTFNAGSLWGATGGATVASGSTVNYGGDSKNDASCNAFPCDIHAQTDASSTFTAKGVPEPGTLALLGACAAGLGAIRRRRTARS